MRRWIVIAAGAVVAVGCVAGVTTAIAATGGTDAGRASRPSASANATDSATADPGRAAAGHLQDPAAATPASTATPVSVAIPSIGVDAKLEDLHRDSTGALEPPTGWDDAGWFSDGVVPGQVGPAVIAGHVDSPTTAAVFYKLDELAPGDDVEVRMSDGTTQHWTVTKSQQASKKAFPTSDVYGSTPTPQLRLITCGGIYDPSWGHYVDNLIVFASPATP